MAQSRRERPTPAADAQPASRRLSVEVVRVAAIRPEERERMLGIMRKYYENVEADVFHRDLDKKTAVILLRERGTGFIQGFSTLLHVEDRARGRRFTGIFSGDTVVEQEFWGTRLLGKAFLRHLFLEKLRRPHLPLYWFLISKGYKTYLLMANNFAEHFPRFEQPTPASRQAIMDRFYGRLYPGNYDPASGLIRFEGETCRLRTGTAAVCRELIEASPRVAFFQRMNPGWEQGTELACLARMTLTMPFYYAIKSAWKTTRLMVPALRPREEKA